MPPLHSPDLAPLPPSPHLFPQLRCCSRRYSLLTTHPSCAPPAPVAQAWAYAAAVKGCLLALITAAAIFLGDGFDLVMTVGGASVVTAVALLLPISANLKLFRHSFGPLELLCNLLLLAFALAFAAWGTHSGLAEVGLV